MVKIEYSYGLVTVNNNKNINKTFNSVQDFIKWHDNHMDEFKDDVCELTTYIGCTNQIIETSDLVMGAILIAQSLEFYEGDCIKFTARAEYQPEDK